MSADYDGEPSPGPFDARQQPATGAEEVDRPVLWAFQAKVERRLERALDRPDQVSIRRRG